jgi:hypothetical protein
VRLQAIRHRCPEMDAAARHVAGFARMIKDLYGDENTLTKWIGAVDADLPALRSFTTGLRRDLNAVVAGLTLEYNSDAVEGTVNRVTPQGHLPQPAHSHQPGQPGRLAPGPDTAAAVSGRCATTGHCPPHRPQRLPPRRPPVPQRRPIPPRRPIRAARTRPPARRWTHRPRRCPR